MKVITLTFALVIFVTSQVAISGTQNLIEKKQNIVEKSVTEIIRSVEKSLPLVEKDANAAIQHIELALDSVTNIKESFSKDTHVEEKSPLILKENKEYWFSYPRVDKKILKNKVDFPVLNSKYESEVLYKGNAVVNTQNDNYAYFDYPFAFASLQTAKDALESNEIVRAKIALKWVFEAIYITPDFLISKHGQDLQDIKLHIDSLINIKGDYPINTNFKEVS